MIPQIRRCLQNLGRSVFANSSSFSTQTAQVPNCAQQRIKQMPQSQDRFRIKVLLEENQDDAIKLMEEVFFKGDPTRRSFYKKFPERMYQEKLFWDALKKVYGQDIFARGLSVGLFDLENREQLIGIIVSKDITHNLPIDFPSYESSLRPAYAELQKQLFTRAFPSYLPTLNSVNVPIIEHWFMGIKEGYTGKRLLSKMIDASDYVAYCHKYAYSFCWSSNFKTCKTLQRVSYEKISEINAKEFFYKGEQYFEEVGQLDKFQSLWIKRLGKEEMFAKYDR